jgi:hypothetical protein
MSACTQRAHSGDSSKRCSISHRPMVHSELPISVLFYGQDGTHLVAMTNGLIGSC